MKSIITIVIATLILGACNNAQKHSDIPAKNNTVTTNSVAKKSVVTDPVCGMEKETKWTDFIVNRGDTVWFCSETCKEAFEATPKRYEKNLTNQTN